MNARDKYLSGFTQVSNAFLCRKDIKLADKQLLIWSASKTPSWLTSTPGIALALGVDAKTARAALRRLTEAGWYGDYHEERDKSTGLVKFGGRPLLRRDEIIAGQNGTPKNGSAVNGSAVSGRVLNTVVNETPSGNETPSTLDAIGLDAKTPNATDPTTTGQTLRWIFNTATKQESPDCFDCRIRLRQDGRDWPESVADVTKAYFEDFHARGHIRKVSK